MDEGENYWQISPGYARTDAVKNWEDFRNNNIIAIGYNNAGNLSRYASLNSLSEIYKRNDANSCWYFKEEIKEGDFFVAKKGSSKYIYGLGRINGPYDYREKRDSYKNVREVKWLKTFDTPKEFPQLKRNFSQSTVNRLDKERFIAVTKILGINFKTLDKKSKKSGQNTKQILDLLKSKSQIIFYGPPGTGKTYKAREFAVEFIGMEDYDRE